MTNVLLRAAGLTSKWGFADGDILDDILFDAGLNNIPWPDQWDEKSFNLSFEHEVLARCVETYLLPAVPSVKTFRIVTGHNPIRTDDTLTDEERGVWVTVTVEQVLKIAQDVLQSKKKETP